MPTALEYFSEAGTAVAAGVFIPVADLPGLLATELETGDTDKESKAILALLNTLYDIVSPPEFDSLGWSVSKGNPQSSGPDIISQPYSAAIIYHADFSEGTLGQLPIPSAGANADVGKIGVEDIFENAAKVAAGGAVSGAGIVITSAALEGYGAPAHASLDISEGEDNRDWFAALLNHIAIDSTLRTAQVASALTARTRGNAVGVAPVPGWTAATNPTTDLVTADLATSSFLSVSYSFTVQLLLDQQTQTFDVNHVTA